MPRAQIRISSFWLSLSQRRLQLLAQDAQRRSRRREAVSLLERLRDEGGRTWYAAWAAQQLRSCT